MISELDKESIPQCYSTLDSITITTEKNNNNITVDPTPSISHLGP